MRSGEPVDCCRQLQNNKRPTGATMMQIRAQLTFDTSSTNTHIDFDPGGTESFDPLTSHQRVRVGQGDNNPGDSSVDDGLGTRPGLALVTTWLERGVHGRTAGIFAGFGQCVDLGMRTPVLRRCAGEDSRARGDCSAHPRIWRRDQAGCIGHIDGPAHVVGVASISH